MRSSIHQVRSGSAWKRISDQPRWLRMGLYAIAVGILLYMCLAPQERVPGMGLFWDKWEHVVAWFVLTVVGFVLAPRRQLAISAFAVLLGVGIELLQATLGFGRRGDWLDLVADTLGVLTAVVVALIARHVRMQ